MLRNLFLSVGFALLLVQAVASVHNSVLLRGLDFSMGEVRELRGTLQMQGTEMRTITRSKVINGTTHTVSWTQDADESWEDFMDRVDAEWAAYCRRYENPDPEEK